MAHEVDEELEEVEGEFEEHKAEFEALKEEHEELEEAMYKQKDEFEEQMREYEDELEEAEGAMAEQQQEVDALAVCRVELFQAKEEQVQLMQEVASLRSQLDEEKEIVLRAIKSKDMLVQRLAAMGEAVGSMRAIRRSREMGS